jgi:hypothetical protein
MRDAQMKKVLLAVAILLLVAMMGCGSGERKVVDPAPFQAALVQYLRVGSMEMKPEKFESIEVQGDEATAKVRMATKEDLYGIKPLWTVGFRKKGSSWEVAKVER